MTDAFPPERIAQLRDPRFPKDSALSDDIKHLLGECRAAADEIEQERASLSAMVQQNGDLRAELSRVKAERDEAVEIMTDFATAECDYMRINNLGDGEKQHNVKRARSFLSRMEGRKDG